MEGIIQVVGLIVISLPFPCVAIWCFLRGIKVGMAIKTGEGVEEAVTIKKKKDDPPIELTDEIYDEWVNGEKDEQ